MTALTTGTAYAAATLTGANIKDGTFAKDWALEQQAGFPVWHRVRKENMEHPMIAEEFEMVNLEIRVGRERVEALRNLSERTGVEDLTSFVAMLIQADRFGTSIGRAVRVYSEALRTKRRQRAEQAAQKAAVKLLFPLTCFLFPTLFIIILGPAFISIMDAFSDMK